MDHFIRKDTDGVSKDFQVLSWHTSDAPEDQGSEFKIYAFGANETGNSVCLQIDDFTPFFYVKVPYTWSSIEVKRLEFEIRKKLGKYRSEYFKSCLLTEKMDIYGFTNKRTFKFVRLLFTSFRVYNAILYYFRDHNKTLKVIESFKNVSFPLYNSNVNPLICFTTIRKILLAGWISLEGSEKNDSVSRCQLNLKINWKKVVPVDKNTIAPFTTISFDIECYSSNPKQMPDPTNKADKIIQIGSSISKNDPVLGPLTAKHVVVLGPCDPVKDVTIISVSSEAELIKKWVQLIVDTDPDQLIGYNIDDFDWSYIYKRAELLGTVMNIGSLSRLYEVPSTFKDDTMESKAYGMNIFRYIQTPGINQIDLLHWFRREVKMDSYKLDAVSERFLKERKRDVTPQQIFSMAGPEGTSASRSIVAEYCAQDTLLPTKLLEKMAIVPNLIEMAKVTRVPIHWLLSRGQQIKVFSQIFYEAWYHGYLIPTNLVQENFVFQGAHVFEPMRGAYFKPISGLDFASLYPSIMIAYNLCPTTWVRDSKYMNIEGIEYENIKWENSDYHFVQNIPGLVPTILDTLWKERKKVKKQMEKATGMEKVVLNGKQLAIKVSMNSIYGFFGVANHGMLSCIPIASSVTYIGRIMIEKSKQLAEEWYNGSEASKGIKAIVRYGDSVPGYVPVMIKKDDKEIVIPIEKVGKDYISFQRETETKEESRPENMYAMTHNGYSKILRVVRHKTSKKLYKITCNEGTVIVTEDHSLLTKNLEQIKPSDLLDQKVSLLSYRD